MKILIAILALIPMFANANPLTSSCEQGNGDASLCYQLSIDLFNAGHMPVLRDGDYPLMCYVGPYQIWNPKVQNFTDTVVEENGKVFKSIFRVRTFSATAGGKMISKQVGTIQYRDDIFGSYWDNSKVNLPRTRVSYAEHSSPPQIMTFLETNDASMGFTASSQFWINENNGQLLVNQEYTENSSYAEFQRELRCFEIK